MRRWLAGGLAALVVMMAPALGWAAPPDPLRLAAEQADLFIQIEQPRRLVETLVRLEALQQLRQFKSTEEFFASTNVRRAQQLLAYFEKQLGAPWPELVERLSGGGAVVAIKFAPDPVPTLLVVQGTDPELMKKFARLAGEILEQELARQEVKERPRRTMHRGVEVLNVGKEFHAAVIDAALLISNNDTAIWRAIDQHLDKTKGLNAVKSVAEARALMSGAPLAWGWLNLEALRKAPGAKEVFAQPRNDPTLTVLFGGLLDVARRAPFVCGSLDGDAHGFRFRVQMPSGRAGMPPEMAVHIPPAEQATRPPLEPAGMLVSTSFYLDLSKFWDQRTKLFNAPQVKTFEDFDKKSGTFLLGNRISKLFGQAGTNFRVVVAGQSKRPATDGRYRLGELIGYAVVVDARAPQFGKAMESIVRGAALVVGTQLKWKLVQEEHHGVKLIGYRTSRDAAERPENAENPLTNLPSPCFAVVGDQVLLATSVELGREMIELLQKEAQASAKSNGSNAAVRTRISAAGGANLLHTFEDQLLAQTILNQALPPDEARQEVRKLIDIVRGLGDMQIETHYGEREFRFDITYRHGTDATARRQDKQPSE